MFESPPCLADTSKSRICVPTSDGLNKSIGEGVEEILVMRRGKHLQI
jgi:hypothetical protein